MVIESLLGLVRVSRDRDVDLGTGIGRDRDDTDTHKKRDYVMGITSQPCEGEGSPHPLSADEDPTHLWAQHTETEPRQQVSTPQIPGPAISVPSWEAPRCAAGTAWHLRLTVESAGGPGGKAGTLGYSDRSE